MLQFLRRTRSTTHLPADDLLSVGLVGLRRAAARYDPARKTRFSTTATVWVLQVRLVSK
jgi:DNA-directed RNA polymerase specialized sigma subunit